MQWGGYEASPHFKVDNLHYSGQDLSFHSHFRCGSGPYPEEVLVQLFLARCVDGDPRQEPDEAKWTPEYGCAWVHASIPMSYAPPSYGHWTTVSGHHTPSSPPPGVTYTFVGCAQKLEKHQDYLQNLEVQATPNKIVKTSLVSGPHLQGG